MENTPDAANSFGEVYLTNIYHLIIDIRPELTKENIPGVKAVHISSLPVMTILLYAFSLSALTQQFFRQFMLV